jgi:hypothetical protein
MRSLDKHNTTELLYTSRWYSVTLKLFGTIAARFVGLKEVIIMRVEKSGKNVESLFSDIVHPHGGILYSLFILPAILMQQLDPYYIDAGTAGMIVQGLIGAAVAGMAMGVVFRRRITDWVRRKFRRSGSSGDEEDTEDVLATETKTESDE